MGDERRRRRSMRSAAVLSAWAGGVALLGIVTPQATRGQSLTIPPQVTVAQAPSVAPGPAPAPAPAAVPPVAPGGTAQPSAVAPSAPASAPATTTALSDPVETLRSPAASQGERDEAARRLVLRQTPESRQIIAAALADVGNRPAQLAAARAIPLDPEPDQGYVHSLFALVRAQPVLSDAAIAALASYRAPDVRNSLIDLAIDPQRQHRETTRVSAIRAVGTMSNKRAAAVLVNLVTSDGEPPAVINAAAAALSEFTASPVTRRDAAEWQRWWAANQNADDVAFERDLLEARSARLLRLQHRFDRFANESKALLSELYQAAAEKDKEPRLLRYLRSGEPELRVLGAQIVQDDFKQTRPIPPSVRDQLRAMVGDSASPVRVAVAQALFILNDAQAVDALLAQLSREPDAEVRMELAKALVPIRDARVIEPLLRLLNDPSLAVVEVAARGLGDPNLAPLVQKSPDLSTRVTVALRQVLDRRTAGPGTAAVRAAVVDAMGALKNPNLRDTYQKLLNANEPVIVRRAVLRALGQLEKPGGETWPAEIVLQSLIDAEDAIRLEAVRALKTTADYGQAERLYEVMKTDRNAAVRDEAWAVLRNLFDDPKATDGALAQWADQRFQNEPERRIEVLQVLAKRLTAAKNVAQLAPVHQNIGAELMKLAALASRRQDLDPAARDELVIRNAKEADTYFDLALRFYRERDPQDQQMTTSELVDRRIDALITSKEYDQTAEFAAQSITLNQGNQEIVGRRIRNEIDRLREVGNLSDALTLIEATNKMNPRLAEPIAGSIRSREEEIRRRLVRPVGGPQSAVGSGQ